MNKETSTNNEFTIEEVEGLLKLGVRFPAIEACFNPNVKLASPRADFLEGMQNQTLSN